MEVYVYNTANRVPYLSAHLPEDCVRQVLSWCPPLTRYVLRETTELVHGSLLTGLPESKDVCSLAAQGGHLSTLQWARANGCEWDSDTCAFAAEGGHLPTLQWARENGCEWDEDVRLMAAKLGYVE